MRLLTASTADISTFAGNGTAGYAGDGGAAVNAEFNSPAGLAVDSAGNVYIADSGNSTVRKVDTSGNITTFAGTGVWGYSGDGGPAGKATLANPIALAIDSAGNHLYRGSRQYQYPRDHDRREYPYAHFEHRCGEHRG